MAQDDKYGLEPADEKYGLSPAGTAAATAEPPSDEEIEAAYGKDVSPKIRAAVKSGVAKMQPPTKFEQDRPQIKENYGFTPGNVAKNAVEGAAGLVKSGAEGLYDVGFVQGKDEEGNIKHGVGGLVGINDKGEFAPMERLNALTQKYVTDPAVAEWNKGSEEGGFAGIGHKALSTIPLVGPWAGSIGEQAGTGDIGGATGQVAGQVALGELAHHAPALADKVVRGTPLTEAGKLAAAKEQALTVKKPTMTETEYSAKVQAALPDLQKVAQDNTGKIKTPRDAVGAINRRVQEMEAPIGEHLKGLNRPEDMVHVDQYHDQIDKAIDAEMAKHPGQLTAAEIEKAKTQIDKFVGDQPKTLEEVEGNRKRLNQDAEDYYKSRPADKRVMDSSDATAIAQRAAANAIRSILYGDDANPGLLEKAGVTAVDQAGNQVPLREFRQKVGNLLEVRDHFEDAIVRAEQTGNWKAFDKLHSGPSLAAGGLGAIGGLVAGGPLGALFGTLAGEGVKAWGDYLRSKNPNLNVQKMFRNLEATGKPNTIEPVTRDIQHQYQDAIGPQTSQHAEPIGPARPPGNFQMEDLQPNQDALWQQQVGQPPPLETGAPSPGRHVEPIGPQPQAEAPLGPIQGQQIPLHLPSGPEEAPLFGIGLPESRKAPAGAPEAPAAPPAAVGGPGREGTLGRIDMTPKRTAVEDLKVGDTFVDDKGDPRRITDITEDGTVKTADHTMRDYKADEIEHLGEINSPRAQLARGGVFHAGPEEDRYDLGEIGGTETPRGEEVAPMERPTEEKKIGEPERKEFLDAIKKLGGDTELADEQWHEMSEEERAHALDRYRGQLEGKGPRTEPVQSVEKAIDALKERVKDRSHKGQERDYQVAPSGEVNPRQLYQTTFLLDDGSALQGDMGIKSHMQLAREVGQHHLNDANAIRIVTPDSYELHGMPSEAQLAEMNRYFRELSRADRQNVHDAGYVYWDFYPKEVTGYSADAVHADHATGAGSFSDFRRAIDEYYSPTTTVKVSPDGSSVKLMENPLNVKGTGEKGRVSTADLLKAFNKYTKQTIGKLSMEKAEPAEMVERAKSLAEDEAKYQLARDNSGAAWYTKQMDEHDAVAQQMRPDLRDPAKLSLFKMAEAVLSAGQKPYGNFKSAMKAWDGYVDTGKFPERNPETGKSWGPRSAAAYGNALGMLNNLIEEHGEKGASDWLLSEHPVSELRKYNENVSGKMDSQRPGVLILGEKRGLFAQNLHKIESAFTADMWVARTWNRWMGTAEVDPKTGEIASDAPRNDSERALMRETFDATAEKLGLSTSALQAVLWYYEQALHNAHGVPKESWSFSDAAKRASDEEAGIATTTKSGKAVKPKAAATLSPVRQ